MKLLKYIYIIAFFVICGVSFAQVNPHYIKKITEEQGLQGTNVADIIQDSKGLMWFATNEGVSKYDGTEFTHYQRDINNPQLPTNSAYHIFEDTKQNIWICTHFGISKYDPRMDQFELFLHDTLPGFITNPLISFGIEDSDGNYWFAAWDHLNLLTDSGFVPVESKWLKTQNDIVLGYVMDIVELPDRRLLFSCFYHGLIIFDLKTSEFSRFCEEFTDYRTQELMLKDSFVYAGTWTKCFLKFDLDGNLVRRYETMHPDEISGNKEVMSFDTIDGKFILGTYHGLKVLDETKEEIIHYLPYENNGKVTKIYNQIFVDDNRGLWMGSGSDKLNYLNHYYHSFKHYKVDIVNPVDARRELISLLSIDENGKIIYDSNTNLFILNSFDEKPKKIDFPSFIKNPGSAAIVLDNHDGYWLKYQNNVYKLEMDNKIKLHSPFQHKGTIYQIWINDSGEKWMGTNRAICRYDPDGNLMKKYAEKDGLNDPQHLRAFEFKDGTLGLTAAHVIYKYNQQNDRFYPYFYKSGMRYCGCDNSGRPFFRSNEGVLVHDIDTFLNFTTNHGLPSNRILGMAIDQENTAWLATSNGLSRFDISHVTFKNFFVSDGLLTNQFLGEMDINNKGDLVLSHMKGLTKLNVNEINDIPSNGKIVFTDMLIHNKSVRIGKQTTKKEFFLPLHISYTEKVTIPSRFNVLTFRFSLLDFYAPEKNTYDYYLQGFDQGWTHSGKSNSVTYTNLDPGNYTLKIRAYNGDGVLSSKQAQLELQILPFWYQTWLFKVLVIVFLGFLVGSIYFIRIAQLKRRQILLEKQVKERTAEIQLQKEEIKTQADNLMEINKLLKSKQEKVELQAEVLTNLNATKDKFFSIIAHDLKNPFQGILGFTDVLIRDNEKLENKKKLEIIELIQDTSKGAHALLENLLQWARSQTRNLEFKPTSIDIKKLVLDTFEILKLNAGNKKVALVTDISDRVIAFADKNMILTVIRNLVNNAIKYTPPKGEVTVKAYSKDETSVIEVRDNGTGMSEKILDKLFRIETIVSQKGTEGEKGTGLGLIICKEFIEKNSGTISVESAINQGTTFKIELPASKEVIPEDVPEKYNISTPDTNIESSKEPFSANEKMIALLVDDDKNLRFSMKNYLSGIFLIHEAGNGKEGLDLARKMVPDVIISDVMMPEMDGIEMSKKLKDDPGTSHIPIVLLTARISEDHMIEGLQTGADDYINKPVSLKILEVKIENLINIRRKLRENFKLKLPVSELNIENKRDKEFLEKLSAFIEKNIASSNLNFETIALETGMSKTQLYRKLKALTNQTVNEYVRVYRLNKAAAFMRNNPEKNVSEAAYIHGFSDPKYFSKSFKEVFGKSPSEYLG